MACAAGDHAGVTHVLIIKCYLCPESLTTILPWSGRPTYRLGACLRGYDVRHDKAYNRPYFNLNNEPNNVAKNCWNNVSNNCG